MKVNIKTENINFRIDQNIIYCEFQNNFDSQYSYSNLREIFSNTIQDLSNDKYMPMLINLKYVDNKVAIRLFKFFSDNTVIKETVLSTTFLVRSFGLKVFLDFYDFLNNTILPHKICINLSTAIKYCEHKIKVFNGEE